MGLAVPKFHQSWRVNNQGDFFSAKGNQLNDISFDPEQAPENYYSTTATANHAIECLANHQKDHTGKPFFHYLAFIAPHFPLHAPQDVIQKYKERYLRGWDKIRKQRFARQKKIGLIITTLSKLEPNLGPPYAFPDAIKKLGPGEVDRPIPWDQLSAKQKEFQATKMAIHAAMIEIVDQEIGRVLAQLKKMKAFANTLILFASDNGASAEIMIRSGGHDPQAPLGSSKSYLWPRAGVFQCRKYPFSPAQNLGARRWHQYASHRTLARRHSSEGETSSHAVSCHRYRSDYFGNGSHSKT